MGLLSILGRAKLERDHYLAVSFLAVIRNDVMMRPDHYRESYRVFAALGEHNLKRAISGCFMDAMRRRGLNPIIIAGNAEIFALFSEVADAIYAAVVHDQGKTEDDDQGWPEYDYQGRTDDDDDIPF